MQTVPTPAGVEPATQVIIRDEADDSYVDISRDGRPLLTLTWVEAEDVIEQLAELMGTFTGPRPRSAVGGGPVATRPAWCPPWCTVDHAAEEHARAELGLTDLDPHGDTWQCESDMGVVTESGGGDRGVALTLATSKATGLPLTPGVEIQAGSDYYTPAAAVELAGLILAAAERAGRTQPEGDQR